MAAIAVNGIDGLEASDLELTSPGPSYTADTLQRLHEAGLRRDQIFFITGADAFAEIETWSRYPAVLDLSHFVVVSRPGHDAASLRDTLPAIAPRMRAATPDAAAGANPAVFLLECANAGRVVHRSARAPAQRSVRFTVSFPTASSGTFDSTISTHRHAPSIDFRSTADHLHGKN